MKIYLGIFFPVLASVLYLVDDLKTLKLLLVLMSIAVSLVMVLTNDTWQQLLLSTFRSKKSFSLGEPAVVGNSVVPNPRKRFTQEPTVQCEARRLMEDLVNEVDQDLRRHAKGRLQDIKVDNKDAKENFSAVAIISTPRQGKTLFLDMLLRNSAHGVIEITCNSHDSVTKSERSSADSAYRAILVRVIDSLVGRRLKSEDLEGHDFGEIESEIRRFWLADEEKTDTPFVPCLLIDELTALTDPLKQKDDDGEAVATFWKHLKRLLLPLVSESKQYQLSLVYTGFSNSGREEMVASGVFPKYHSLPEYTPDSLDDMLIALLKIYQSEKHPFPSILWELSKRSAGLLGHQLYADTGIFRNLDHFIAKMNSGWPAKLRQNARTIWTDLREYIIKGDATPADVLLRMGSENCMTDHDGVNCGKPAPFACAVVVRECFNSNAFPKDKVLGLTHEALMIANEKCVTFNGHEWKDGQKMPEWHEHGKPFEKFILKALELRHLVASEEIENSLPATVDALTQLGTDRTLARWQPKNGKDNLFFKLSCVSEKEDLKKIFGDFHYHLFPEGALAFLRDRKKAYDRTVTFRIENHKNGRQEFADPVASPPVFKTVDITSFPVVTGGKNLTEAVRNLKDGRNGKGSTVMPNGDNAGCEFAFVTYDKQGAAAKETILQITLVEAKDCRRIDDEKATKKITNCFDKPLQSLWALVADEFKEVHVHLLVLGRFKKPPVAEFVRNS